VKTGNGPKGSSERRGGLFRAALAGPGRSLTDAFANLDSAPGVQRVYRHPTRKLVGTRLSLPSHEGAGYWELTQIGDDVYVVVENFAYKDPRVEIVPGDGMIQFYFKLAGDLTMGVSRTEPLRLNRPSLLVYNQPTGIDLQEWTAPSAHERCVAISVRPQFLLKNFFSPAAGAPHQLGSLASGSPGQFQYCQLPLSAPMFEIATRLVDNPLSDILGLINTEALTLELLCAAIAGFMALDAAPSEKYSERDLRRLHAARDALMKQLAPAPTIGGVAAAVGMSQTSLKNGFKAVFGETVFEFSVRCRMQQALTLLRDRRMAIGRVAEAVGYKHQTSFATAFRRHFGMRPKDVRPNSALVRVPV
jgi:AraC-like DNA-binding protein